MKTSTKRTPGGLKPFSDEELTWAAESMAWVHEQLDQPPPHQLLALPELHGSVVAEFVIPLKLCPTENERTAMSDRCVGTLKSKLWRMMALQAEGQRIAEPLQGYPQIIIVRFSRARRIDRYSDGGKWALDMLCKPEVWRAPSTKANSNMSIADAIKLAGKGGRRGRGRFRRGPRRKTDGRYTRRLAYITDDDIFSIEEHQIWRPFPKNAGAPQSESGIVFVQVRTGREVPE